MVITDYLERNARLWGNEIALVEVNPSEERDAAMTWREASLVAEARPDAPYRREMSWRDFDRRANRFANLLLSRGVKRGTKVAMLLMNCLEFLPIYFGILKAGCIVVPMNKFREMGSDAMSKVLHKDGGKGGDSDDKEEESPKTPDEAQLELLVEIRDLLKEQKDDGSRSIEG